MENSQLKNGNRIKQQIEYLKGLKITPSEVGSIKISKSFKAWKEKEIQKLEDSFKNL